MNAAVLVDGLVRGGLEQARAELQKYWEAVGEMPGLGTLFSNISGEKAATTPLESIPAYVEAMKKNLSPYDLPLANDNPMRRLLTDLIDFDRLRSQKEIQLTVCATNARTARRRVFTDNDLSVEALLASACLPQLFRAVDIDGEPYWDGALTGNPALGPLLTKRPDGDLIIVRVDPVNRPEAPRSQRDILNRTVEISHNSTFWLELGAIAVVLRFLDEARSPFRRVRFHIIEASPIMERFPMSSKLNNYPPLLEYLFNLGRVLGSRKIERRSVSARRWTYSGCCLGVFGTISECCRLLASPLENRANITRRMSDQAGAECNPNRGRSLLSRGVVDLPHERRKRRAAERAC